MTEVSHRRKMFFSALTGLLVAFCYVAGYKLDRFDSLDLTDQRFYFVWAATAVACGIIIHFLYLSLDRAGRHPWLNPPREVSEKMEMPTRNPHPVCLLASNAVLDLPRRIFL